MTTPFLFALALVIRSFPAVNGSVECPLSDGQQIVSAYSAEFEPIWHHGVQSTIVDRLQVARTGRVTGLGPSDRLVLAIADEKATAFDTTQRVTGDQTRFPYSPEIVRAYEKLTGRDYERDMMQIVATNLGSHVAQRNAVSDLYSVLFAAAKTSPVVRRTFGEANGRSVLVLSSPARTWCWLDSCFREDGVPYARKLAAKGWRVDLAGADVAPELAVDADGFLSFEGRRLEALVLRHISHRDAVIFRRLCRGRTVRTKVYATDAPLIYGSEVTWSDPEL